MLKIKCVIFSPLVKWRKRNSGWNKRNCWIEITCFQHKWKSSLKESSTLKDKTMEPSLNTWGHILGKKSASRHPQAGPLQAMRLCTKVAVGWPGSYPPLSFGPCLRLICTHSMEELRHSFTHFQAVRMLVVPPWFTSDPPIAIPSGHPDVPWRAWVLGSTKLSQASL